MIWYRDVLLYKATKIDNCRIQRPVTEYKEQARKSSYEGIELILESLRKRKPD